MRRLPSLATIRYINVHAATAERNIRTPLMAGPSPSDHAPAHSSKKPHKPSIDYNQSAQIAHGKITQCKKLLTFARFIRERGDFALRTISHPPSEDDKSDFSALKRQWQDLLNNNLLESAGKVLTRSFLEEAEFELRKLDQTDAAARQSRVAWEEVVSLVAECMAVKGEVEEVMVRVKCLLSSGERKACR